MLVVILLVLGARPVDASTVRAAVSGGTLVVTGTPARDRIALRLSRAHPNRLQVDIGDNGSADLSFRLATFARIDVEAGGGNDRIRLDTRNGAFTITKPTRVHGGKGDDTLIGGNGNETFFGGDGNDVVDGNGGADRAILGSGTDTFTWNPHDGSDVVRGDSGADTLVFTGSDADKALTATAIAGRVSFTRSVTNGDPDNSVTDLDGIEAIHVAALAGNELVTVNDLAGTDLARFDVDLAPDLGSIAPDHQKDTVAVIGTAGNDAVAVTASGATVRVDGLAPSVRITHADADADKLVFDTLAGDDQVTVDPAVLALISVSGQ